MPTHAHPWLRPWSKIKVTIDLTGQQSNVFSKSVTSIQVILMLVLVLLFHINIETSLHFFVTRQLFCQALSTSAAHNSPITTPRSSRQPPTGVEINVVFHPV